ncbi:MAG TPA: hypothetical protein VG268_19890 [Streptosporangiaceae bacterium]|nr:hypothetical protein [Streptosporangiaceae bacterium]
MRGHRVARSAAVGGSLLALTAVVACAGPSRPAPGPAPGLVVSNYERATGDSVPRDCGYSTPLPARPGWSLWLFCDTAVTGTKGARLDRLILGTDTAAAGPYRAGQSPVRLSELPTPPAPAALPSDGAPEPFLPAPQNLVRPGSTLPCSGTGTYPAAWITGVAREAAEAGPGSRDQVLISYNDYCVTGDTGSLGTDVPGSLTAEGAGLIEYDPATNRLGPPEQVFGGTLGLAQSGIALPVQQVLGSPVFDGGYLYQFGFCSAATLPTGCATGKVFMVRVQASPAAWRNPLSYQYWTGSGWSLDPNTAASVLPASGGGSHPLGVSAGDYRADGHGLVVVEQTSLAGDFQVWQASSPAGPWRHLRSGRVPCRAANGHGAGNLCRAVIGHPELSTSSRLLISYFNPGNDHVDTSAFSW